MEQATPSYSPDGRDPYNKRAQKSDFVVLTNLFESFKRRTAGTLDDHTELLSRVLSDACLVYAETNPQHLSPSEWLEEIRVANAYAACNLVCIGFENEFNRGSDHGTDIKPPPIVIHLCCRVAAWTAMFIQSTRILQPYGGPLVNTQLLESAGSYLWTILLSSVRSTLQRPSFPLFDAILAVYIRLARDSRELMTLQEGQYLTIIKKIFLDAKAERNTHPNSIWTAMERRAVELAEICIGKITAWIDAFSRDARRPWVPMQAVLQHIESIIRISGIRRELAARGMLPLLCQLLQAAVHAKIDIVTLEADRNNPRVSLTYILRTINHLLEGGQPSATLALQARLLPNLFRIQPFLDESLGAEHIADLRHSVERVMFSLEQQLFYRSTLQLFFKSNRYIERLIASDSISQGVLWPRFARLYGLAQKRKQEMAMVKIGRVACANSRCTSDATNADVHVKRCSGCLTAEYCSSQCRHVHWKTGGHRSRCSEIGNLRKSGSTLVPINTRDINFIYFLVIQEMARRQDDVLKILRGTSGLKTLHAYPSGAIRGPYQTHPEDWSFAETILVFDFAPVVPLHSSHLPAVKFSVSYPALFLNSFPQNPYYSDFDVERFQEIIRTRKSRGPFIAIISSTTLLDFTNMDCIVNRVY